MEMGVGWEWHWMGRDWDVHGMGMENGMGWNEDGDWDRCKMERKLGWEQE